MVAAFVAALKPGRHPATGGGLVLTGRIGLCAGDGAGHLLAWHHARWRRGRHAGRPGRHGVLHAGEFAGRAQSGGAGPGLDLWFGILPVSAGVFGVAIGARAGGGRQPGSRAAATDAVTRPGGGGCAATTSAANRAAAVTVPRAAAPGPSARETATLELGCMCERPRCAGTTPRPWGPSYRSVCAPQSRLASGRLMAGAGRKRALSRPGGLYCGRAGPAPVRLTARRSRSMKPPVLQLVQQLLCVAQHGGQFGQLIKTASCRRSGSTWTVAWVLQPMLARGDGFGALGRLVIDRVLVHPGPPSLFCKFSVSYAHVVRRERMSPQP
jgi:hypothetical protein